jgi:hypothetical protein
MTAFGGGGAIAVPLLNEGIQWLGRRETLIWTDVGILAVTLPVSFVIRAVPRTWAPSRRLPSREAAAQGDEQTGSPSDDTGAKFTFREAIPTRTLWFISVGASMWVTLANGMMVHNQWDDGLRFSYDGGARPVRGHGHRLRARDGFSGDSTAFHTRCIGGENTRPPDHGCRIGVVAVGVWGLWLGPGIFGLLHFAVGIATLEGITSVNLVMVS